MIVYVEFVCAYIRGQAIKLELVFTQVPTPSRPTVFSRDVLNCPSLTSPSALNSRRKSWMSSGTSFHMCASRKALTNSNCLYHREILETVFYLYYLYYRKLLSVITFMEVSSPAKLTKYNLYITCVKVCL